MLSEPKNMIILDSVDSTNNYAMALIQKRQMAGEIAVFAKKQTNGKGRRGKQWVSNEAENITMSVVVPMQWLNVSRQFELSVAVALSCHDLFQKHILANLFIKWPNDIFINDSKAGGILIENVIKGKIWQWSVIGIGLNINQEEFEEGVVKATSLKIETERQYDVIKLAGELYGILLKRIEELKADCFENMLKEYNQKLYGRGQMVRLKKQTAVFETEIIRVSPLGQLITKDSVERSFNFDEVEFKGFAKRQ
jgi:BirA family biotin operon repressor/biotin-[acetyl-CoA-carboxylase] ligase